MTRLVAFLRAVNVGGHVVRMEELRALFEALAFTDVATFIASGNVVFQSRAAGERAIEARIERHLRKALGWDVATFVRTPSSLADIASREPFPHASATDDSSRSFVAFTRQPLAASIRRSVEALSTAQDELHVDGREIYWFCRTSARESTVSGAVLEKAVGGPVTVRNVNTVRRLVGKLGLAAGSS
jgi:uncharacterized protein (DUF1697 family)